MRIAFLAASALWVGMWVCSSVRWMATCAWAQSWVWQFGAYWVDCACPAFIGLVLYAVWADYARSGAVVGWWRRGTLGGMAVKAVWVL